MDGDTGIVSYYTNQSHKLGFRICGNSDTRHRMNLSCSPSEEVGYKGNEWVQQAVRIILSLFRGIYRFLSFLGELHWLGLGRSCCNKRLKSVVTEAGWKSFLSSLLVLVAGSGWLWWLMRPTHCLCFHPVCRNLDPWLLLPASVTECPAKTQGSVSNRWGESGDPRQVPLSAPFTFPPGHCHDVSLKNTSSGLDWNFELVLLSDSGLGKRGKQDGVVEEQMVPVRPTWPNPDSVTCYLCDLTLCCWASLRLRSLTVERCQRCLPHKVVVIVTQQK